MGKKLGLKGNAKEKRGRIECLEAEGEKTVSLEWA